MYTVTVELEFCYGHRLLNYDGKCRYPHGHNGRLQLTMRGDQLDANGMLVDFTVLKKDVNRWIDETLDHRMILHESDPLVAFLRTQNEPVCPIPQHPTTENIARMVFDYCGSRGYPIVEVTLWETSKNCASYGDRAAV